ncbi:MAG TPA: hypothetical protein VGA56_06085 [Opitutaceae bacterium]
MNAILLTVFVGFILVSFFVVLFLRYRREAEDSSPERDSLLPLEEEGVRLERPARDDPATARR